MTEQSNPDAVRGGAAAPLAEPEISLLRLVAVPLRHVGMIAAVALGAAVLGVLMFLVGAKSFAASSTFQPQTSDVGNSRFAGIAAQFGVAIPTSGQESVAFYAELLRSRELLFETATSTYTFDAGSVEEPDTLSGDLIALLGIEGDTRAERERGVIRYLGDQVGVQQDLEAGLITLNVQAPWPALAIQINRRMLDLLNRFNLEKRQSQAAQEREFVESRMKEAEEQLLAAEGALERFLQQNRTYASSPQLSFEAGRLQRRVDSRQQIYASLAQAYEQARIDEVRNIPVITVLDPPERFARRAGSGLIMHALLGLVLGGLVGLFAAFIREYVARTREERPDEYDEFVSARARALAVLDPRRLLRRRRGA